MFPSLTRPAAALGLSLLISIGGLALTTAPARAQQQISGQEVAQFLGGLVALYAIGRVISEAQDRAAPPPAAVHAPQPEPPRAHGAHGPRPQWQAPHRPRGQWQPPRHPRWQAPQHGPRHQWQPQQQRVAPARCFIDGQDRNGYFRGYGLHCMQNNVRNTGALPNECLRRVETQRGAQMIYGGRCLFQNGWVRG